MTAPKPLEELLEEREYEMSMEDIAEMARRLREVAAVTSAAWPDALEGSGVVTLLEKVERALNGESE